LGFCFHLSLKNACTILFCCLLIYLPVLSKFCFIPLCPKSIRTWARKTKFCIWMVTIPNPLQSRPLVTPHT
jgi:hypothetical protein